MLYEGEARKLVSDLITLNWKEGMVSRKTAERNLTYAIEALGALGDRLAAPDLVVKEAAYIFSKAYLNGVKPFSSLVAASLFAVCRSRGVPRTLKEVVAASAVEQRSVYLCYREIASQLHLRLPPPTPVNYISRAASEAGISANVQRRALGLIRRAEEKGLTMGKDPVGMATAALYVACVLEGEYRTQKELAEAAGVTEVTLRSRARSLSCVLTADEQAIYKRYLLQLLGGYRPSPSMASWRYA